GGPGHHPDGGDAGAAHAGDEQVVGPAPIRRPGRGQARDERVEAVAVERRVAPPRAAAVDGDEARTESVGAAVVLVAGRLVDAPLSSRRRVDRHDRQAVRLRAAVAAGFADRLVDEDAPRRIGILVALATTALLGGAG